MAVEVLQEWLPNQGGLLSTYDVLLGWRVHGLWTQWCDWPGWNFAAPLDPEVRLMWATQLALESMGDPHPRGRAGAAGERRLR